MGENNTSEPAVEEQLLIERIEVASEIVRSSQAAVAFQRAFYLEILTLDRVENEIDEITTKINKLQAKLSTLFNELQHAENDNGAGRASVILEKLEILKHSYDDEFKKRVHEARRRREEKSQELNNLVVPALNSAVETCENWNWGGAQTINLMPFVSDDEYHLAEDVSEEWGKIRRKCENYLYRYMEETTSLRVEVFGATYTEDNASPGYEETTNKSVIRRLSNLMSRKTSSSSTGPVVTRRNCGSATRSESFFYCSPTPLVLGEQHEDKAKLGHDLDKISEKANGETIHDAVDTTTEEVGESAFLNSLLEPQCHRQPDPHTTTNSHKKSASCIQFFWNG